MTAYGNYLQLAYQLQRLLTVSPCHSDDLETAGGPWFSAKYDDDPTTKSI